MAELQEKHGRKMTRAELVREAKLQTDAIQRLNVWLRLGYSLVALGFILGMWGYQQGQTPAIVGGVVCLVIGVPVAIILKVGTTRAHRNVENILAAAGVDVEELKKHPMEAEGKGDEATSPAESQVAASDKPARKAPAQKGSR